MGEGNPVPLKRDWMEMTWQDFTAPDMARWIAVLPVAAIEQHGPHLPLGVDTMIGEAYLARVRTLLPDALPVTFLPVQAVGTSEEHRDFPGTLSLPARTMIEVVAAILSFDVNPAGPVVVVVAAITAGSLSIRRVHDVALKSAAIGLIVGGIVAILFWPFFGVG